MHITVAICTWNRSVFLNHTLRSMHDLIIPSNITWELLIVNNNCTDSTDEILEIHANHLPIRRLFEPEQGHSASRNLAISDARGELIVWTDDDVLVSPDWLVSYIGASSRWPNASYFGGPVEPWFEFKPPRWIMDSIRLFSGPFAIINLGIDSRLFNQGEVPVGANMAFRTEAIRGVKFDPKFGRVAEILSGSDEFELFKRLQEDGRIGAWVPEARVRHFIPASRMRQCYLSRWFWGNGQDSVRMGELAGCKTLFGVPRWVFRDYVKSSLRELILRPLKNQAWCESFKRKHYCRGIIASYR